MADKNIFNELDSVANSFTLNYILGKIIGVIKVYRSGFIDMKTALERIEEIVDSIEDI